MKQKFDKTDILSKLPCRLMGVYSHICIGIMVTWEHDNMVIWERDNMVIWEHDNMVIWEHDNMVMTTW